MKKSLLLVGAALLALGTQAQAQNRANNRGGGNNANNTNQNRGGNNGGVLPLPEGLESVVSIDAFNILLAQINRDGRRDLSPIIVRHIYSGGVARLFGGSSVPTEQFVTPGTFGGGNGGGNGGARGGGGFQNGGQNGGQNTGFGGGGTRGGTQGGGQNSGGFGGGGNFGSFQMRPSLRGRN